jgi:mannosyltransferase OCH1-like enzyme
MIPKIIHQIYLGFDGPVEDKPTFIKSIKSIKEIMPDWEYKIWSEKDIKTLIYNRMPNFLPFYENLKHQIQKVDIGRYVILLYEGGFYMDMDIIVKKRFDDLLNNKLLFYEYNKNNRHFEIDFIGSEKNNNFWIQIINQSIIDYKMKLKIPVYNNWKARFVMQTTGPYFFDRTIKKINPIYTKMNIIQSGESEGDYAFNYRTHSWGQ